ncbi:MAG TPA: proton-conducting transporter membrane subunit [Planctomycetota bacterium]|nr:proton-conducting transporter membrane subunit [Planctomycetota bacterium]
MTSVSWILVAIATLSLSGLPGIFGAARATAWQYLAAGLMLAGSAAGLAGVVMVLCSNEPARFGIEWFLPAGRFAITVDPLCALFLVPVFVVPALGAIYGLGYWNQAEHSANGRKVNLFYGLLAGSMALVTVAGDAVLFLIAWEVMALAAYFAATAEDDDPAVCRAGWVYLVATHVGTLCLVAMFTLWHGATGSWAIAPAASGVIAPGIATAIFLLAVIGFGCKAGLMPLHVWLPGAHANAPSHVSAVMSGVMLKMGIYGIVRMTAVLDAPPAWWGGLLLAAGAVTGVLGIAFALGQRDLKRLLAYSSIENIGIITLGIGLALLGRSLGHPDWVLLGLGGALLHVWNHSLFKSLLFFNAGAIIHAAHTREIDRLGGLAKSMPRTAGLFLLGAVAICALPPLNGFASEWLLYLGLFRTIGIGAIGGAAWAWAGFGAAALALIGALAVACFVQLFGVVFLGTPRSESAHHAHDPSVTLWGPMALLGMACIAAGFVPWLASPWLERAAGVWWNQVAVAPPLMEMAPMRWLTVMGLALVAGLAAIGWLIWRGLKQPAAAAGSTWGCGYARPTPRMQYTGSSFGQTLVDLFNWALWPRTARPQIRRLFAETSAFQREVPDTVLDRLVLPVFRLADRFLPWLRLSQQGVTQVYVAYFVAVLLLLFLWSSFGI